MDIKWIIGILIALVAAGSGVFGWHQFFVSRDNSLRTEPIKLSVPDAASFVQRYPVSVEARTYWSPTGIKVKKGDWLVFSASGEWWSGISQTDPNGDGGIFGLLRPACGECPVPEGNLGELVGRIEGSPPFRVGAERTLIAPQEGELRMAMNENTGLCLPRKEEGSCYDDNRGNISVRVELYRVQQFPP